MKAKPILASDLDGTLFREAKLTQFWRAVFRLGMLDAATEREFEAIYRRHRDRLVTHRDYDAQMLAFYYRNVKRLTVAQVERAAEEAVADNVGHVYVFTRQLITGCEHTHDRVIISSTLGELARAVQRRFGFDAAYASESEKVNGRFTGIDTFNMVDKGAALLQHGAGNPPPGSIAIGDTVADAAMLRLVDYPIAFMPNMALTQIAQTNNWPIVEETRGKICVLHGVNRVYFGLAQASLAVAAALAFSPHHPA